MSPASLGILLSLAATREVKIPVTTPARVVSSADRTLAIGAFEVMPLHDLDVAEEIARYLESELGNRTGLKVRREPGGARDPFKPDTEPAPALRLAGRGRLDEATVGAPPREDRGPQTADPGYHDPLHRPRWSKGYRLRLSLTLTEAATGRVLWQEFFDKDKAPELNGSPIFGLYELLDPVAKALVQALVGGEESERRVLIVP